MRMGWVITGLVIFFVVIVPVIAPYDPMATSEADSLLPPNREHVLGTDLLGRDVLSRFLHGGQRTLFVSLCATVISIGAGAFLGGLTVGAKSGWLSSTVINSFLAFPPLLTALVILTLLGAGWWQVAAATGIAQIAAFARLTRSTILPLRSAAYVEAACVAGATQWHVFRHHLLTNAFPILAAYGGVVFGYCLLNSAALSFLGLSGQPGIPDWGVMLEEGRRVFQTAPWVSIAPGLGITVIVYLVNRAADMMSG